MKLHGSVLQFKQILSDWFKQDESEDNSVDSQGINGVIAVTEIKEKDLILGTFLNKKLLTLNRKSQVQVKSRILNLKGC